MPRFIVETADGKQIFKSNVLNIAYGGSVTLAAAQAANGDVTLTIAASAGSGTPSATVTDETTWGITPAAGASADYSRGDHTHGSPTAPGAGDVATDVIWDAVGDLAVGTGANTAARVAITVPGANILEVLGVVNGETTASWKPVHDATAPSTQAFGDAAAAGTALTAAHRDHKHAMPADPVTAHESAGDPHTGYQKESEKDAASGYVGLSASSVATITGGVGVGTGVPTAALLAHVRKDYDGETGLRIQNATSGAAALAALSVLSANSGGFLAAYDSAFADAPLADKLALISMPSALAINIMAWAAAGFISLFTGGLTADKERLRISATGLITALTGALQAKPSGTAGIQLDPNAATGNFTGSLSPANLTAARRWTFPDADLTVGEATVPDPNQQSYSPGSFTLLTEQYAILSRHLKLTTTQRATLQGTGTLRIV